MEEEEDERKMAMAAMAVVGNSLVLDAVATPRWSQGVPRNTLN